MDAVNTPDPQAVAEHLATVIPDDREAIDDQGSLSDHEAQFGSGPKPPEVEPDAGKPRAEDGRFQPRHRAKSQEASADDVKVIKDLTRQLREKEEALGKIDPEAVNGAARVLALKRQIRGIEAHMADKAPKPTAPLSPAPAPIVTPPAAVVTPAKPVAEKFAYPTFDAALAQNPNLTYEDWQDARDDAKHDWRMAVQRQQTERETQEQQQRASVEASQRHVMQARQGYIDTMQRYLTEHPDRRSAFESVPDTPPLMNAAIITLANGPDVVYRLRQQPALFHEAALFAYDKPVDDATVAHMQRWLEARVPAGSTGAAATPTPIKPLPSPPTPVRTGSNLSGGTPPPGDGASLSEHERFYHKSRR